MQNYENWMEIGVESGNKSGNRIVVGNIGKSLTCEDSEVEVD